MTLEKVPHYTYVVIKHHLNKCFILNFLSRLCPNLNVCMSVSLSLVIIPIVYALLLSCLCYKQMIDYLLQQKYGKRYRGLLPGIDSICANQEVCTPSFFLLLDYNESLESLREKFVEFLKSCTHIKQEKVFYSMDSFMGYHYYYMNKIDMEDYVTIAQDDGIVIRDKADFSQVIVQYDTAPMPDNNKALLHIIIYPQQVQLPHCQGTRVVCLKMHHSLADGKAVLGFIMAELAEKDNSTENGVVKAYADSPTTIKNGCVASVKKALFEDKLKVLCNELYDDNILSGTALKEEKFICWFSDQTSGCIDKIRAIRKARYGVSFLDVINTCISCSLQEYFTKHSRDIPETVSAGVVLSPAKYSFHYGDENYKLNNEFSIGGFRFPIVINKDCSLGSQEEILSKLNYCQNEYEAIKNSIDVQFNYWTTDIMAIVPYQLARFVAEKTLHITMGVSSLPGTEHRMNIFGGHQVKDIVLMAPNSPGTALHFVICSYGKNRLRLSLTIDKSVVSRFADAQSIVDGIVKYLDLLHKSVC